MVGSIGVENKEFLGLAGQRLACSQLRCTVAADLAQGLASFEILGGFLPWPCLSFLTCKAIIVVVSVAQNCCND